MRSAGVRPFCIPGNQTASLLACGLVVYGVKVELTIEAARALYGDADSVHDFDHILRVLALSEHIAAVEGADLGSFEPPRCCTTGDVLKRKRVG